MMAIAAALAAASLPLAPAHAALGEDLASVESDRVQVRASVRAVPHSGFTVHELSAANQGVVREYVSPAGKVFAVSWHGPAMPNLRQVLGTQFDVLARARQHQAGTRGHLAVTAGTLVFESNGRMRSFHGRAYLSDQLPEGVRSDDIE